MQTRCKTKTNHAEAQQQSRTFFPDERQLLCTLVRHFQDARNFVQNRRFGAILCFHACGPLYEFDPSVDCAFESSLRITSKDGTVWDDGGAQRVARHGYAHTHACVLVAERMRAHRVGAGRVGQ
jgi:hypothetical protein